MEGDSELVDLAHDYLRAKKEEKENKEKQQ